MSYNPTSPIPSYPMRGVGEIDFTRHEPLVDSSIVKEDYLFGIPLQSALTNETLSDASIERHITRAVSKIEHMLNINISPVTYTEKFDYHIRDYEHFNFIQLHHWPVSQVVAIKAKYPNSVDHIVYPIEWVSIYNESGMLQLTPTNGNITQFFITNDAGYIPLILGSRAQWPQLWEVEYIAGFEDEMLPAAVNHLVGIYAAMSILSMLGVVFEPINSYSIGMDSLSQSVGMPGPTIFQLRYQELQEESQQVLESVKRMYNQKLALGTI